MSEKYQRNKVVTFNVNSPVEKFMLDHADNMKKTNQSFSGLMKQLYLTYLVGIGNSPPGSANFLNQHAPAKVIEPAKNEVKPKVVGGVFAYDDDE